MRSDLLPQNLLRRHVGERPDQLTFSRDPRQLEIRRKPEIAKLGRALSGQPDVAWFDIAMDDAAPVRIGQRLTYFVADPEHVLCTSVSVPRPTLH